MAYVITTIRHYHHTSLSAPPYVIMSLPSPAYVIIKKSSYVIIIIIRHYQKIITRHYHHHTPGGGGHSTSQLDRGVPLGGSKPDPVILRSAHEKYTLSQYTLLKTFKCIPCCNIVLLGYTLSDWGC